MTREFLEDLRTEVAEGPRPRQMLVTLMAEYWVELGARAPSGALVELMEEFGVPGSGARTLLSRICRRGRLEQHREGRRTFYSFADGARGRVLQGFNSMARFGRVPGPDPFIWTTVVFSVPEAQRPRRLKLHKGLSWMGFAPLYDGVWVSPQAAREGVAGLLRSLEIDAATVFEATAHGVGRTHGLPTDAWSVPLIRSRYEAFLDQVEEALAAVDSGRVTAAEALVLRTQLINVWRWFPRMDPGLPLDLLPADWPRQRAAACFRKLYAKLEPLAVSFVRAVVERHSAEHLDDVRSHRIPEQVPEVITVSGVPAYQRY